MPAKRTKVQLTNEETLAVARFITAVMELPETVAISVDDPEDGPNNLTVWKRVSTWQAKAVAHLNKPSLSP